MPESEQAMCFMAGANAVFTGDQMLTTPCKLDELINYSVVSHDHLALSSGSPWDEVTLPPFLSYLANGIFRIKQ